MIEEANESMSILFVNFILYARVSIIPADWLPITILTGLEEPRRDCRLECRNCPNDVRIIDIGIQFTNLQRWWGMVGYGGVVTRGEGS